MLQLQPSIRKPCRPTQKTRCSATDVRGHVTPEWELPSNLGFLCGNLLKAKGMVRALAVGFAAMANGDDFDGIGDVVKAEPVVADAEPELGRINALELMDIALAGGDDPGERVEGAEGGSLVNGAKLGLGSVVPDYPLIHLSIVTGPLRWVRAGSSHAVEVLLGEAVFGQDILMRHALAPVE